VIVVADASVLVAELIRTRGRELAYESRLHIVVAEEQWNEARHELDRRLRHVLERGHLTAEHASLIHQEIQTLVDNNAIEVVPRHVYHHLEATARRRIPRDPDDWPTVALAPALDAGILTGDNDFLGCGCPTWSFNTLRAELDHR